MNYLDAKHSQFQATESGALQLILGDGIKHSNVYCAPLFPISSPDRFIAVMVKKEKAKDEQVGIIKSLDELPKHQRQIVCDDLRLAHFLPEIIEVRSVKSSPSGLKWDVNTDRGPRAFTVTNARESTTTTADGVSIITDQHRMRYRITNVANLDRKSQIELEKAEL